MRKRNIAILFRLNRKEAEALDKRVKKSGLSREAYLRQLINGLVPRNAPPPDYYDAGTPPNREQLKSDRAESPCAERDRCAEI